VLFGEGDIAANLLAADLALGAPAPQGDDGFAKILGGFALGKKAR
jgi:hypothetical protein